MEQPLESEDTIDIAELLRRLRRGLPLTIGLCLIGLAAGATYSSFATTKETAVSALRVAFAFPGFERGTYPNGTKFQPDDIRAPDVVGEAAKRLGIPRDLGPAGGNIRGAMSITGLVSPNVVKERDRLRALGQTPPPLVPDEYEVTLSLPRNAPITLRQRELLLGEIVNAYLEKFRRNYVQVPPTFGNAFSQLKNADFVEYELILTRDVQSLAAYLDQLIAKAKQFRAPTTDLSFQDLRNQTDLFTQIYLSNVLGLIYTNGLTKDRDYALVKIDYYMRTLRDQERLLQEEESVVNTLLNKTQERAQNYVLANKSQATATPTAQPLLDQTFIDTLLANDAYNFLVRKALDAGLALKHVQSEIAQLEERRKRMESSPTTVADNHSAVIASTQKALVDLEVNYRDLLGQVRTTLEDYSRQEFADAVRITMQPATESMTRSLVIGSIVGLCIGLAAGLGFSLLRSTAAPR